MNLTTVALMVLAWQLLTDSPRQNATPKLTDFLSDETKSILQCAEQLSQPGDKTAAILEMLSNPTLVSLVQSLLSTTAHAGTSTTQGPVNSEGYRFEAPSNDAQQFFHPIENIADAEVKHKLYTFYDNWYVT